MNQRARTGTLLAGGYGCYQAVSSSGYLTAMGTAATNLGFVTTLPFMMGGCLAGALAALAIAWLARARAPRVPAGLVAGAYGLFALLPLASALLAWTGCDGPAAPTLIGAVRGLCTSGISLVWVALFVRLAQHDVAVLYVATFALSSCTGLVLRQAQQGWWVFGASCALLLASLACACALVRFPACADTEARLHTPGVIRLSSPRGWGFYASWLCLLVCEFIVGVANTAVFNSDFSATMEGVNMSLCMLVAVGLLCVLLAFLRTAPDPTAVFKACMPAMLAVFSVMPLVSDRLGPLAGFVMVVCYDTLALAFSVYLVSFLRDHGYSPFLNVGVFVGVSNLVLLLGLSIGMALNALWSARGVPLLTLLAFVAIYPVGLALLFVQKAHARPARPAPPTTGEQVESHYAAAMAAFSDAHGLTRRESQICALLVRGRSVKFAAQELGVTENTAWTHTKNLYTKCGVGTRQDLMDLFERARTAQAQPPSQNEKGTLLP